MQPSTEDQRHGHYVVEHDRRHAHIGGAVPQVGDRRCLGGVHGQYRKAQRPAQSERQRLTVALVGTRPLTAYDHPGNREDNTDHRLGLAALDEGRDRREDLIGCDRPDVVSRHHLTGSRHRCEAYLVG